MSFIKTEIICGIQIRNIIFHCPSSIKCLMTEEGSNLLTCPLKGGRGKCQVWSLREELENRAKTFWEFIKTTFEMINEKDLIYPERMELEQEQKHFLSLLFLGIGTYHAKNKLQFPKSWGVIERILGDFQANQESFFELALDTLTKDSQLSTLILNDSKNTLLSEKSLKGIILLLCSLKWAIEESFRLIPEEESERLIEDINNYLKSK